MKRIYSIDFVRGLIMIIMALDHIRDLLGTASLSDPTNMGTTTPLLFFTRWITHFCAPLFVFLSGTSAWLSIQNRGDMKAGRIFLLKRGIWLIILEFTVIGFLIWTDLYFRTLFFQVIAAIGCGFILLALLAGLPPRVLAVIGLVIIFGHDLFSWPVLLTPKLFPLGTDRVFFIGYPILPWAGIMLTGFASGRLFEREPKARKKLFLWMGLAALGLFILLRFINRYGDPAPWSVQKNAVYTFLSFLNVSKYPPSLLYTLVTLAGLFLLLSFSEGKQSKFITAVSIYGKVPLFYYILHWALVHASSYIMIFAEGFHITDLRFGALQFGRPDKGSGIPLAGIYGVWIAIVLILYPVCRWYARYKSAHRENKWLRYL